jgi:hypothetical protein
MTRFLRSLFSPATTAKRPTAKLSVLSLEGRAMPSANPFILPFEPPAATVRVAGPTTDAPVSAAPAVQQILEEDEGDLKGFQMEALKKYFKTNDDIANFIGEPAKLLNNPELDGFFKKYANALLAVRAGLEIANANDLAAAKLVFQAVGNKVLEHLAPNFSKAFRVYGWVKTGMELMKTFVVDPARDQRALDEYFAARKAFGKNSEGAAEDAWATVHDIGHILDAGTQKFKEMYGNNIFVAGTDKLLPPWQRKLERELNKWFEGQYQLKLLQETKELIAQKKAEAEGDMPGFDEYMMHELKNRLKVKMTINPTKPAPGQTIHATVHVSGVKDFSKLSLQVHYNLVGTDGYVQTGTLAVDASGKAQFSVPGGAKGVKDTVDLEIVDTIVKWHHVYNF